MKIFKISFLKNKKNKKDIEIPNKVFDQYLEIGKLVKQARIKKNISLEDLSRLTKIPEQTIISIENNIENIRPRYPFIRSILFKLEESLLLKKNTLVDLSIKETTISRKYQKRFFLRKYDFLNTWIGSVLYFLILIVILFGLKKYFYSNSDRIEMPNFEEIIRE
tara:strand:- start:442 stop:933 length:492 start_codon:yes stop_codon:yes gene_type:complete